MKENILDQSAAAFRRRASTAVCAAVLVSCLLSSCDLLKIFGLGEPSLSKKKEEGYSCAPFQALAIANGYLYAADGVLGIRVYSLSNPASPSYVRTVAGQANGYQGLSAFTRAGAAYLAAASYSSGIDELSLADASSPSNKRTAYAYSNSFKRVAGAGSLVAVARGSVAYSSAGLYVFNASNTGWVAHGYSNNSMSGMSGFNSLDAKILSADGRTYACAIGGYATVTGDLDPLKILVIDATGADASGYVFQKYNYLTLDRYAHSSSQGAMAASGNRLVTVVGESSSGTIYAHTISLNASNGGPAFSGAASAQLSGAPIAVAMSGSNAFVLMDGKIEVFDVESGTSQSSSSDCPSAAAIVTSGDYVYIGGGSGLVTYEYK